MITEETAGERHNHRLDTGGDVMNGRSFIGVLLDEDMLEIPVWYSPLNNCYFRGMSTVLIPERTLCYGRWKNLESDGLLHIRKMRAFYDKMLPNPVDRTPKYKLSDPVIPLHTIIRRDPEPISLVLDKPQHRPDDGLVQEYREFTLQTDELISKVIFSMSQVGFTNSVVYYPKGYRQFRTNYRGQALFNISTSVIGSQQIITEALAKVDWVGFKELDFQWPSNNGLWQAMVNLSPKIGMRFTLSQPKSDLVFSLIKL